MNEHNYEYRTGRTRPQKSRSGLITGLLIAVIFLGGVVSVLGLLNIKLFRQLQQTQTETPLSFAQGDTDPAATEGQYLTVAGVTLQELPSLYQQLYNLPEGLYVVGADRETVLPGDVLVSFDGTAVTTLSELNALYAQKKAGDQLWFTFHRQGQEFSYTVPFGN